MIWFNKDSVYSKNEFQKLFKQIEKYDRSQFDYEYSKARSTYVSYEKITDLNSSVVLAAFIGYIFSVFPNGELVNAMLPITMILFLGVRSQIYFTLPRLSMKLDIFEAVGKKKWKL